jgi:hypothetical protein
MEMMFQRSSSYDVPVQLFHNRHKNGVKRIRLTFCGFPANFVELSSVHKVGFRELAMIAIVISTTLLSAIRRNG